MAVLSLRVRIADRGVMKTIQFDRNTIVYDACKMIREKIPEAHLGLPKDYGLFLADDDPKKGVWMESGKTLEYYLVRSGDLLEYKKKIKTLKVRMLDGTVKTLMVDDSLPVGQLMIVICARIGITNHDEYSLVREVAVDGEKVVNTLKRDESTKLNTLTRSKEKKMEQLRRQLHTDEELNWLDHSKTLREQGVDVDETVLLRRKFFFSDQNIDNRDPVQLNLLYVQCRNGILDGTHPITKEEAFLFAGLQCQVQFGDFMETKMRPSYVDLNEFLPRDYVRCRDGERRILQEHRNLKGTSELDAKAEYVKRCRNLKTYGVTFFLVKEKMKGKNRLVPRLLGINKDCVMRVDERTKEVIKVYPLEQVRRWAASPNTFTLDFGDYQDAYYSVQTTEGEKIGQLIAGYIDIILRKKRAKDHFGIEGDEGSTMLEDVVTPARATLMSHGLIKENYGLEGNIAMPAIIRSGVNGEIPYGTGSLQRAQFGALGGVVTSASVPAGQKPKMFDMMTRSQRALVGTIETSIRSVEKVEEDLLTSKAADVAELGQDKRWKEGQMDLQKQTVTDHLAAMGAATAQVIQLTAVPDRMDHTAVGAAISMISSNMPSMAKGVRTIAALMEEEERSNSLLDATRKLCRAITDMLSSVSPEKPQPRQSVLAAAGRVGDYSHAMIQTIDQPTESARGFQDVLVQLAKDVATGTAHLVLKAKTVSGKCEEQALQDKVIHSATQCAFATSQLVACARVVAPTIDSPACQEQLTEAARQVARAVEQLLKDAEVSCKEDKSVGDLNDAAAQVSRALGALLNHIRTGPDRAAIKEHDEDLHRIMSTSDRLISHTGSANDMIRQAKVLAQATTHLVTHIRSEADTQLEKEHLLGAAKRLADATTRMIEAAKLCAGVPDNLSNQAALKVAAEDVRAATTEAAEAQTRRQTMQLLEQAARQTAASATQVLTAARACEPYQENRQSLDSLAQHYSVTWELVNNLMTSVKHCQGDTNNRAFQLELLCVCQAALPPCGRLINSCKASLATVQDQASATQLSGATKTLAEALAELRLAVTKAQGQFGSVDFDSAIEMIRHLDDQLRDVRAGHAQRSLRPGEGETAEIACGRLVSATKVVGTSVAQFLSAGAQMDESYMKSSGRDVTDSLRQLVSSVRAVCANVHGVDGAQLVDCARDVMSKSVHLFEEIRRCTTAAGDPDGQQRLALAAKALTMSLNKCVNSLPGQQNFETFLCQLGALVESIGGVPAAPSDRRPVAHVQDDIHKCASRLTDIVNRLVADSLRQQPHDHLFDEFVQCLRALVGLVVELASLQAEPSVADQLVSSVRVVGEQSCRLLLAIKAHLANPAATNAKGQLTSSARVLIESLNRLVDLCTGGSPWQKECDSALRNMQAVYHLLDYPSQRVSDGSYFDCLDLVTDWSARLGEGIAGVTEHVKRGDLASFGRSVRIVGEAVCALGETAAQAAYLLGVADVNSVQGQPELINMGRFNASVEHVLEACQRIASANLNQAEILQAATVIAKQTTLLANICRDASGQTSDGGAKRHFINYARDVASSTASLIKAIKALDHDFNQSNLAECQACTRPLLCSLDNLSTFVLSPEFAGVPGQISEQGRLAQQPIVDGGHLMIDGSMEMIKTSKLLALNAHDASAWQLMATYSKAVSDSIKGLISAIRSKAPGQGDCDNAIDKVATLIRTLEQVSLAAINQSLEPTTVNTEQGFYEQIDNNARQIGDRAPALQAAAKAEAESIGHRVRDVMVYFDPLAAACVGAASLCMNSTRQMALLDQCKTVAECQLQLLYATKSAAGNAKALNCHANVDESGLNLSQALGELLQTVAEAVSQAGSVAPLCEDLRKAMSLTDEPLVHNVADYADYQTRMVHHCKEIGRLAQEMVAKGYSNVDELLAPLAMDLVRHYCLLADETRGACAAASSADVAQRIRGSVQQLGASCLELVKAAGACRADAQDQFGKQDLAQGARRTVESVALVLAALRTGARGTQACINAASTVSGIIGDLDTTIMFATAGSLNPDQEGDVFSDHREAILRTAKALVEDTKALVAGAASSQEQLAVAAQNAVRTIVQLSDVVKSGAAALTSQNAEAQVLVINAVKDVAAALSTLVQATKSASGKSFNDPAMGQLKEAAKVMVTNVTSLLKTVKTVEDENQRGTRALESAIEAVGQEIRLYESAGQAEHGSSAPPDQLFRVTKPITEATAKAVAAGQSCQQDDVIAAANMARRVVSDLLNCCRAVAGSAETAEMRYKFLDAGRNVAVKVGDLLQTLNVVLQKPTSDSRRMMTPASRLIAQAVTDLVAQVELLKDSDLVDLSDPAVIAENELLGAASSIEAAARKLGQLKPRPQPREAVETLNFDEQILQAAKSIATAVTALVKAASAAQRELVAQGRVDARPTLQTDDYQWSEGLISAARMVAAATHSLCEAANALMHGHASEEKLISAAKQVAASTAHLLVACKVKADINSKVMRRLQAAGNAVKTATEHLVRAAKQAIEIEDERTLIISQRMVSGIAQVLDAQEEVLRKERELEEARVKLATIRKAKYKGSGSSHEGSPEIAMDNVQFGMLADDSDVAHTPADMASMFKPPSVAPDGPKVQPLFPPMTPLISSVSQTVSVQPHSAGSIPTFIPPTPSSDGSMPVPQLQNIVSTVNLGCKLDLKKIALHARNAEYNPKRFAAVIMRIRDPRTTALIFSSGKMVCTGAKSEDLSRLAARKYARIVQKLGFDAKFMDFKVQNMVGSCDVRFPIQLEGLCLTHSQFSTYEPELFPGLIYRMVKPRVVLLIFVSGKVVITGAKEKRDIDEAFTNIYPILRGFRKQ